MKYFVGIDPSINSTGICVMKYTDDGNKIREDFIILKPYNKEKPEDKQLSKKEKIANDDLSINFEYMFYESEDISIYENNLWAEYWKSFNMINLVTKIKEIVADFTKDDRKSLAILIEGISYGSKTRTKSIFDLAGLNYLIREKLIRNNIKLNICPPAEIKKFASGKGNANKDILIEAFLVMFPQFSEIDKLDDLVDAYFMCKYAFTLEK